MTSTSLKTSLGEIIVRFSGVFRKVFPKISKATMRQSLVKKYNESTSHLSQSLAATDAISRRGAIGYRTGGIFLARSFLMAREKMNPFRTHLYLHV